MNIVRYSLQVVVPVLPQQPAAVDASESVRAAHVRAAVDTQHQHPMRVTHLSRRRTLLNIRIRSVETAERTVNFEIFMQPLKISNVLHMQKVCANGRCSQYVHVDSNFPNGTQVDNPWAGALDH